MLCIKWPDGFVIPGKEHLVYKLKRSLYGLKQALQKVRMVLCYHMGLNGVMQFIFSTKGMLMEALLYW